MPSNRKGFIVQQMVFSTPGLGGRPGWRNIASQRTKRQAMRTAKSWHQGGFEVRVIDPQGSIFWQR